MQRKAMCSLAFKKSTPSEKVTLGGAVAAALSNNPKIFVNLPVSPDDLLADNNTLSSAVQTAKDGSHTSVSALENAVAQWDEDFTNTANYISIVIAEGNKNLINMSRFPCTKTETTPVPLPSAPADYFATINGKKGAVIAGTKKRLPNAAVMVNVAMPDGVEVAFKDNVMSLTVNGTTIFVNVGTRKEAEFYELPTGVPYTLLGFGVNAAGSGPATTFGTKVIPQ